MNGPARLFAVPMLVTVEAASAEEATRVAQAVAGAGSAVFADLGPVETELETTVEPRRLMDVFGRKVSVLVYDAQRRKRAALLAAEKANRPPALKGPDILKRMAEGWELGVQRGVRGHLHASIQKGGLGRGGEAITVNRRIVQGLLTRGLVRVARSSLSVTVYELVQQS